MNKAVKKPANYPTNNHKQAGNFQANDQNLSMSILKKHAALAKMHLLTLY